MIKFGKISLILIGFLLCSSSLVHETTLTTWEYGCIGSSKDLLVGESEQDPNVCGILVCMNLDGLAYIYFCQQPAAFQNCYNDTVSLTVDYPDCCWQCTRAVEC